MLDWSRLPHLVSQAPGKQGLGTAPEPLVADESTTGAWEEAGAEQEPSRPPRREGRLVQKRREGREGGGEWMAVAATSTTAAPQTLSHLSL